MGRKGTKYGKVLNCPVNGCGHNYNGHCENRDRSCKTNPNNFRDPNKRFGRKFK